jgi:RNA polymerase sigma-70 factor (ECF subfamily)
MTIESDWLAEGDDAEAAFVALVESFHTDLVRVANVIVGDPQLANDVVQSAWVAAWRHRGAVRDPQRIRGWLFTIAVNEAKRAMRRRALRGWVSFSRDGSRPEVLDLGGPDSEGLLDLYAALKRLPVRDRLLLASRYALGESSREIGERTGLSESGVRVRISRLLAQLRKDLGDD